MQALSGLQKVKLAREIKDRDYQELIAQQKVHIENKNRSRCLNRVINQSRIEEQQLSEKDACVAKAKEQYICKQEKLAAELTKVKTEDIRELKMRFDISVSTKRSVLVQTHLKCQRKIFF